MHGLATEAEFAPENRERAAHGPTESASRGFWRRLYHLPGNADVRLHMTVLALLTGAIVLELAFLAAYYNVRWIVRYPLVARRLGGAA